MPLPAKACVFVAGTADTKREEILFVCDCLHEAGVPEVVSVDISTRAADVSSPSTVASTRHVGRVYEHVGNVMVAAHHPLLTEAASTTSDIGGATPHPVFCGDRGKAVAAMTVAFRCWLLAQQSRCSGILGLGGSGGTAIITPAMRALPIGGPVKLMATTMAAAGELTAEYIGGSDVVLVNTVTDLAGLNTISRCILKRTAHQMAGVVLFPAMGNGGDAGTTANSCDGERPLLAISMFGVTTPCVQMLQDNLGRDVSGVEGAGVAHQGFNTVVFHATGSGGKSMEKLIDSGLISGVLDITTTEVCDLVWGGVLACDEDRFGACARHPGVPVVLSCGAVDMINYGAPHTVPASLKDPSAGRVLYEHNAQVTLLRTTAEENVKVAQWIAMRLRGLAQGTFLIPEKGFSALDVEGGPFWDPVADEAFAAALEAGLQGAAVAVRRVPHHINDPEFAAAVCEAFRLLWVAARQSPTP